ncbi:LuxR C-terminal-related transcriptional regulator [Nonomuraea gerenzanensis]|uniref:Signal transduction response regulator / Disease resistance domain-containing protein n=1 Tax=Nonomuraea gerenzanensis TaxID=93944 RepID=A0A1M4ENH1_9ACTN|nr:LuxR C-terminal-related transcriptional regulator [Nonomuraea gerenzanensis]UBU11858.1 LuxR C-terminal-related transcriptional regulator [Nonomuraea gerenzanensis]SBP00368.1 Signal transduction response regulator / Disease resistance domain-containing protein [Nonomuraea gerenzanensis]
MPDFPRHNLPAEPNRFVGRERDLDDLHDLFGGTRVVTLCGVGGIGKTRLALQVAAGLVPSFPDGVWLVELARVGRPELVEQELGRVLGLREEAARPLLDTMTARLRDQCCLLLLDNCEHLVDKCAEVAAALVAACPSLRILATSREPLRIPSELIWRVPPLDLPGPAASDAESVQLFMDRAAAAGTRLGPESLPDVVRLCRALDGLPLALELAAARTSLLSPGQIADRIDDRFSLLTTGGRTAPPRQRTLLAAVEWSYDLLAVKEQVLLRRLSVFAGDFDLDLAEQVCAERPIPAGDIVDLLGGLVDKSLVLCDEGRRRYWLLETIRRYAVERLEQAGEREILRQRHLDVLCELQERHFTTEMVLPDVPWPERLEALTASRDLIDDQRVALEWAVESGNVSAGLWLCRTSTGLLPLGGNVTEIVGWIERLLSLGSPGVPAEQVAHAKAYLAYGLEARDELSRALEVAEESLEGMAPAEAYPRCVMHSLVVVVLLRMGRTDDALHHAEAGLALAGRTGDTWNQAAGLLGLSAVALVRGRLREAQRHGEEALTRARAHGHRWLMARAATQLGSVAEARGDLVTAKTQYELAVPWLSELGGDPELTRCLTRIGRVAAMLHEFGTAREQLAASLELARATGQRQGVARCLVGLSVLAECEGDLEGAVLTAAAAAGLRESIGQHSATTRIEELLGRARTKLGEGRTTSLWSRGRAMSPDDAARHVLAGERLAQKPAPVAAEPVKHSLLTAREQEIAGLLTRGLSNRAIAEELVISPATVARHIANIMEKLGYTSRAQIAVWATEHQKGAS